MALDLQPDDIHRHALKVVRRAHRKAWPLRLRMQVLKEVRSRERRDLWGRPV
jgi:hypothetical protein